MTIDYMKPNLIPVRALSPQFTLPTLPTTPVSSRHLLLGQERVLEAFQLANQIPEQHLYLADFPGIDRKRLFNALVEASTIPTTRYLVGSKKDNALHWLTDKPSDNIGIVAQQSQSHCYLSGSIRRTDLIGKMVTSSAGTTYHSGALATYHTVFICAESLWKRENLWDLLQHILTERQYKVTDALGPIPLSCNVVLVGNSHLYSQLRAQDWQFHQNVPLLGEMASEIDLTRYKESDYAHWLQAIAQTIPAVIDSSALPALLNFASSQVEHQQRLSLSMMDMIHLLSQANAVNPNQAISGSAIESALQKLRHRHNTSEMYSAQSFDDSFINLPTSGAMIGQVNGLTVIDTFDYSYGEPARITASVHYGDGEVADIERKSELGGNIHAKGMMILSACLYRIFGRDAPLHLNANIVFEQSYQEIDGDSASLAEYCCLMSAIAEQPIVQSLAVTGALDQFGNVQAIGGVNEKISGFFNLCERRGLTGEQGVIIPKSNVLQLNLDKRIIDAIEQGQFTLYQIEHMDEAVELLMQMPAGVADDDNDFPDDSLYGLVQQRLDRLAGHLVEESGFFASLLAKLPFYRG